MSASTLLIPGTRSTPLVILDPSAGRFLFVGNSLPENAQAFYRPILEWLDACLPLVPERSVFAFRLPYFNTSSMKALFMLLERIERYEASSPRGISIEWQVEDDDEFMIEAGQSFDTLLDLPLREVRLSTEEARAANEEAQALLVKRSAA